MRRGVWLLGCVAAVSFLAPASAGAGPLRTAFVDGDFLGPRKERALTQAKVAGATAVRMDLVWANVAPSQLPPAFNPQNPDDPAYNWGHVDQAVVAATRHGLEPILSIMWAPAWAERGGGPGPGGTRYVDAVEFGRFARAAAHRYSGTFVPNQDPYAEPLPRVRFWMAWNEPNRDYFFRPQFEGSRLVSPARYRSMVNNFARAVHAVNPTNLVIAGGLAPLGRPGKPAPLRFMREMLSQPVEFDVWSHHPYTSGGPTHQAPGKNDVALGDLPEMRRVLTSAVRARRVLSNWKVAFWVTEFSWDTAPPDPRALPMNLHSRWVSEALYRMWKSGVSLVAWYRIQDDPLRGAGATPYQSGLYKVNGLPKQSRTAFRFPVVAFKARSGIQVWGRTPTSASGRVLVQIRNGSRWRSLVRLTADRYGIFGKTVRTRIRTGHVRARFAGEFSLPFSLKVVPDRYVNPFGCGGGVAC